MDNLIRALNDYLRAYTGKLVEMSDGNGYIWALLDVKDARRVFENILDDYIDNRIQQYLESAQNE